MSNQLCKSDSAMGAFIRKNVWDIALVAADVLNRYGDTLTGDLLTLRLHGHMVLKFPQFMHNVYEVTRHDPNGYITITHVVSGDHVKIQIAPVVYFGDGCWHGHNGGTDE